MTKTAEIVWDDAVQRYKAVYAGQMLCQSANKYRVIQQIREGLCTKAVTYDVKDVIDTTDTVVKASISVHSIPHDVPNLGKPYFSITERFSMLSTLVDMVINRQSPSLLITGDPKLGKSYEVEARLKKAKLKHSLDFLDAAKESKKALHEYGDYIIVKGYSSAKSLYRKLYEYRERLVILDDTDDALKDPKAILILKAALDAMDKRYVSWGSEMIGGSDLPPEFEFQGGVIAITNLPMAKIDEAIKSRGNKVDLIMNLDEKLERIKHVLPNMHVHIPIAERLEAFEFLKENAGICKAINFGTFISVCNFRHAHPEKWRRLAEYSVSA